MTRATALIADDEPLLREALIAQLATAWPALDVIAQARNGRQAIELFDQHRPDICFLDVHMPGLSGIDAARHIGRAAHLVFVTAYDHYAVEAFARGVLDYLIKPVEPARLAETVARLQDRLATARPAANDSLLRELAAEVARLGSRPAPAPLRWIRAQAGRTVRLISVDAIDYLRADTKYTQIAWQDAGKPADALVRTALKDLLAELDPAQFAQVHRSVAVNLSAIRCVIRNDDTAEIHLKGRPEILPVSRSYLHLFRSA